jgi:TPR repeat protein
MGIVAAYYQEGEHVDRSLRKAALWWQRALQAGETTHAPDRLNVIGHAYQTGKGVTRDLQSAFRLYSIAAKAGNMHAQYNAGWYLWRGYGGQPQDLTEARRLFQLSAAQGYAEAREALAKMDTEAGQGPRHQGGGEQQRPTGNGRMTRAQALEILGLQEGASKPEMKAAWVRLMQLNHPDKGGSNYFAKQLNEAREVLGF